jgi:hypothetical protein
VGCVDEHIQSSVNARCLSKIIEAMQLLKSNTSIVAGAFRMMAALLSLFWRHRLTGIMLLKEDISFVSCCLSGCSNVNKYWIKLFTSYGFVQSFTTQGIVGTEGLLVSTATKLACKYTRGCRIVHIAMAWTTRWKMGSFSSCQ